MVAWYVRAWTHAYTFFGHRGRATAVSFSPDQQWLATASADRKVRLWRLRDRRLVRVLQGHQDEVLSVAFSPDSQLLASGSKDKTLKVWQVAYGSLLYTRSNHREDVCALMFTPDGQHLISGSRYGQTQSVINLWRVSDGSLAHIITGQLDAKQGFNRAFFSPDGQWLMASAQRLQVWHATDGHLFRTLSTDPTVLLQTCTPDSRHVIALIDYEMEDRSENTVHVWRISDGALTDVWEQAHPVLDAFNSPNGCLLTYADDAVHLWRVSDRALLRSFACAPDWKIGSQAAAAFSPDGRWLAVAVGSTRENKTIVCIWRLEDGGLAAMLPEEGGGELPCFLT